MGHRQSDCGQRIDLNPKSKRVWRVKSVPNLEAHAEPSQANMPILPPPVDNNQDASPPPDSAPPVTDPLPAVSNALQPPQGFEGLPADIPPNPTSPPPAPALDASTDASAPPPTVQLPLHGLSDKVTQSGLPHDDYHTAVDLGLVVPCPQPSVQASGAATESSTVASCQVVLLEPGEDPMLALTVHPVQSDGHVSDGSSDSEGTLSAPSSPSQGPRKRNPYTKRTFGQSSMVTRSTALTIIHD